MDIITLGDIILPNEIVKSDPYEQTGIRAVRQDALDGTPLIAEDAVPFYVFTLVSTEKVGIQKAALDQLFTIAKIPGAIYTLNYYGEINSVRFTHEDPPVISAVALYPRHNPEPTDWFHSLVIKLMLMGG